MVSHSWWVEAAIGNQPAGERLAGAWPQARDRRLGGEGRWTELGTIPATHLLIAVKVWSQKTKQGDQILLFLLSTSLPEGKAPIFHTSNPEPGCPRAWLTGYSTLGLVTWTTIARVSALPPKQAPR